MKNIIIIFFTIGLFSTLGCRKLSFGDEFLEKAPGVDITKDTIFSNVMYAERFLAGVYRTLPYGINQTGWGAYSKITNDLLEDMTDLSQTYLDWGGVFNYYYTGQYTADNEDFWDDYPINVGNASKYRFYGEGNWKGIRAAHILINSIDDVPEITNEYATRIKGEARMVIALHYSDMYRHFGGVPWLNHAFGVNEDFSDLPRLTARATCDSIVALLDRATSELPWAIQNLAEEDGRFTKASAMGLKARILLFDASPLFNSSAPYLDGEASDLKMAWHGVYDANLWKKAADAAYDLITLVESSGDYKLYHKGGNTYRQDFKDAYYARGNGEILISIRSWFESPWGAWGYTFYESANGWGSGCPSDDYVKMFPMASGLPIDDPESGYNPDDPYINRDPRLYETVNVNGADYQGRPAEFWIGGRERPNETGTASRTGYKIRKFFLDYNQAANSIVQWPNLRLPEIYFTYAEAINEFNNGPTPEAYRCVNIVRNRVGLEDLPAGLTKEEFREAVLLERALEFGYEEVRWFDIIRWKREDVFKKVLHGMNIWQSATQPYTYTYEQFELAPRSWGTNWSPKWYLSAFPPSEVNKRYGLIQNPGW